MSATAPERRSVSTLELFFDLVFVFALNAFFYAQIPMVLSVVGFAAGVKSAIAHAFEPLELYAALALGLGVGLYLAGDVLLRLSIGWGHARVRTLAAVAAVATLPIGVAVSSAAQLAALVAVLLAAIAFKDRAPATIG